jgi:hypothetical protein
MGKPRFVIKDLVSPRNDTNHLITGGVARGSLAPARPRRVGGARRLPGRQPPAAGDRRARR